MADMEMRGMDTVLGIIRTAPEKARNHVHQQILKVGFTIFNESQKQCPVATGTLRASGTIEDETQAGVTTVTIGYGGPAAEYALFVHENLAASHKPPTKAKFLEDPANEHLRDLPPGISEGFEAAVFTQYPQSPSKSAALDLQKVAAEARSHFKGLGKRKGMTREDVHSALVDIARQHNPKAK